MSNSALAVSWFGENAIYVVAAGVSIALAALAGVFRRKSVVGPVRLDTGERVGALWIVLLFAICVSVLVPSIYQSYKLSRIPAPTTMQAEFTDRETVFLSAAGAIAIIVALAVGNELVRPHGLQHLGMGVREIPRAIPVGAIAIVIVLPVMFLASALTQVFWDWVGLEHPKAHQLLRIMASDSDPTLQRLIVLSATVLAPMAEEMLFRGHLQTAVLNTLSRRVRATGSRWAAIVITSLIFAYFHKELWLMPPIFVLSICLGYLYERTGNLWACMLLHSAFNTANLWLFSYQSHH